MAKMIASAEEEENDKKKKKKPTKKKLSPDEARLELIRAAIGPKNADKLYTADQKETITDVIPTGLAELDRLFTPNLFDSGVKAGLPRGFVYEFFGPHAGGKSSLCMRLAAQVTKQGRGVLWLDVESSFVNEWAAAQGVDLSKVTISPSGMHGEYYLDLVEKIARSGAVDLIVIDSVTAMQPYEVQNAGIEIDAKKDKITDTRVGSGAKMMTRFLPNIVAAAREGNTAVIFINQLRMKIGVVYGNPETTPYGEALKFFCSIRLRVSRVTDKKGKGIKKDGEEIGIRSLVKLAKSRMGPPDREVVIPIYYDANVKAGPLDQLIDAGLSTKLIKSRSKTMDNGDSIQTFTYADIVKDGIDEFKEALEYEHVKSLYEAAKLKVPFDDEVTKYVTDLGGEEAVMECDVAAAEGDPGA
jgi:recombination protein RecA